MDGDDASTTFTDETGKTVTANGNAQIDTAQSKFGGAAGLFDGTGDYLLSDDHADWDFGTGDFTIDFWVRFNTNGAGQTFVDRNEEADFSIRFTAVSTLRLSIEGATVVNTTWSPNTGQWYHIAAVRSGSNAYTFVDGTQLGTTGTNSSDIQGTNQIAVGVLEVSKASPLDGWIDELRLVKGTAVWTADFTAPTAAYTSCSTASAASGIGVSGDLMVV